VPDEEMKTFKQELDEIGFRYWNETDNPAYRLFLD
jgi:threonine dehydratase